MQDVNNNDPRFEGYYEHVSSSKGAFARATSISALRRLRL